MVMASSQRDWANDVRYYHGKGQAPRRSIQFPFFGMCVISLAVLTVAALIAVSYTHLTLPTSDLV